MSVRLKKYESEKGRHIMILSNFYVVAIPQARLRYTLGVKMRKRILIIGSLNMDIVVSLKDMPNIGETVSGKSLAYIPGGKGANQACAAGKLSGDVAMLGCVGNDEFSKIQISNLKEAGVNVAKLKISEKSNTGTAIIYVNETGDNSIVVISGANRECDREYLRENDTLLEWCDYLILQMEIPYDSVIYSITKARQLNKTIILNPAPAPEELPDDVLKMLDYITPNETELRKLTNCTCNSIKDYRKASEKLLKKGVKNVLVTLGDQGVLLVNEKMEKLFPARKAESIDTTAAGDCFNAAFVVGLADNMDEEQAIRFANICASVAVTRKGAQSSLPDRKEIEDIIRNL